MNPVTLIHKINRADALADILDVNNLKKQYREAVKLLHPDHCSLKGAVSALIKLNHLKEAYENDQLIEDDAGTITLINNEIVFQGEAHLLQQSYQNFQRLKRIRTKASGHFHRFLPKAMVLNHSLSAQSKHRIVSAAKLQLPQEHVNWILSRLLEVCAWLAQEGYVHAGIHPESVFIVPETHGIILGSFYHLRPLNAKLKTVSAKYQQWYPNEIFTNKQAISAIDLELCKRTAAYLLGDRSGLGIKLKKTHHIAFIDFLLQRHTDAYTCFDDYRKLLDVNFEKKFYQLTL